MVSHPRPSPNRFISLYCQTGPGTLRYPGLVPSSPLPPPLTLKRICGDAMAICRAMRKH